MSLRSGFVAIGLCVAAFLYSPQSALAYSRASGITFASVTHTLSGYSRTWQDWNDADYYSDCLSWVYGGDYFGVYCQLVQTQLNYAHVKADLYSPTGFYQTVTVTEIVPHGVVYEFVSPGLVGLVLS